MKNFTELSLTVVPSVLFVLMFAQQVNAGNMLSLSSPSPSKYDSLTPEENQELAERVQRLEKQKYLVHLPDIPEEVNCPTDLLRVQHIRDVVLPDREKEFDLLMESADKGQREKLDFFDQRCPASLSKVQQNLSTLLSPQCINNDKKMSVDDKKRCEEIEKETISTLMALRDLVQVGRDARDRSHKHADEREEVRREISSRKRLADQLIEDQGGGELE